MIRQSRNLALTAILLVASLATAAVLCSTITASIRYLRPGPGFDFWDSAMPFLQSAVDGPWQWQQLWKLAADAHHLVVPRLLFLIEWYAGDFQNYWLLGFAWTALALSAALMLHISWRDKLLDRESRWISLLLVALALGSAHQMNNLAYAFNQQWTSGLLLTLLYLYGAIRCSTATSTVQRCGYGSMAVISAILLAFTTFSLPSIFVSWLVIGRLLPVRKSAYLVIAAITGIVMVTDISSMPVAHATDALPHNPGGIAMLLFHLLVSSLRYLGSPLSEYSLTGGLVLAVTAIIITLVGARRSRDKTGVDEFRVFVLGYMAFMIMMAASTAIGRIAPEHAISPRFRTYILPFLVFAAIAMLYRIQLLPQLRRALASCLLLSATLAILLPGHFRLLYRFSGEYDPAVSGMVALANGMHDPSVVHQSGFAMFQAEDNRQILKYAGFLQSHDKGIYASGYTFAADTRLAQDPVTPAGADSYVGASLKPVGNEGYTWRGNTSTCSSDGKLFVVDQQNIIIGSGLVDRTLPDDSWRTLYEVYLPYCSGSHPASWTAYIRDNTHGGTTHGGTTARLITLDAAGVPVLVANATLP